MVMLVIMDVIAFSSFKMNPINLVIDCYKYEERRIRTEAAIQARTF